MSGAELPNPTQTQQPEASPIPSDPLQDLPGENSSEQTPETPFPPGTVIAAEPISMVAPEDVVSSTPKAVARRSVEEMSKKPDWLPADWTIDLKVRASGATAGLIDRYYVSPTGKGKFRSKVEVLSFLETGSKRKKSLDSEVDAGASEKSGSKKQKKANAESKKSSNLNSDTIHPPVADAESAKKTPKKTPKKSQKKDDVSGDKA